MLEASRAPKGKAMSETKWTPGPWAVHPFRAYVVPAEHLNRPIGCDTDDATDLREFAQEICLLHWPDRHRPESEVKASAHLIAAAPDLYRALGHLTCNCCEVFIADRLNPTMDANFRPCGACSPAVLAMRKARGEQQ
jgi:hypothetical protein